MASRPAEPTAQNTPAQVPRQTEVSLEESQGAPEPGLLTLEDCYRLALRRSETIQIKKEEVAETTAQFLKATSELVGDVDFTITNFQQDAREKNSSGGSGISSLTASEKRERKIMITQPLFQGFRSLAALGAAGSLRGQRKQERARAEQLLFLDVARAFYNVTRHREEVKIMRGILKSLEERIADLRKREQIGRSRASEVATATSRHRILKSELARARGNLQIAVYLLEFLTGVPIDAERLEDTAFAPLGLGALDHHLALSQTRPDLKAAEQAVKTAWRGILEAQSDLWPEVTLENNHYLKREGLSRDINWDLLFKVNIPLSRGGETMGNLKESVSRWNIAKLNESLARRQADLDVKESYEKWRSSVEELRALAEAVEASQNNFDLQKEEYAHNLVSNLDVLEALEQLYDTQLKANATDYDMRQNYHELQVASGACCESI